MPKIVAITGGIGSGKSRIVRLFSTLGIPCYQADERAKALMNNDPVLKEKICAAFGDEAYQKGNLHREYLSKIVFNDPSQLANLNGIVHPAVANDFNQWVKEQKTAYVVKEVAILFETGGNKKADISLLVTAPEQLRIERVMQRDQCTQEEVERRMANQWSDKKKIPLADFVLQNIDWEKTQSEVNQLHKKFLLL